MLSQLNFVPLHAPSHKLEDEKREGKAGNIIVHATNDDRCPEKAHLSKCTFLLIIVRLARGFPVQAFPLPKARSVVLLSSCVVSARLPNLGGLYV